MADGYGRIPHHGVQIPGHVAMVYPRRHVTSTVYGTYDQQPEADEADGGDVARLPSPPSPITPARLSPPHGRPIQGPGGRRGSRPDYPRGQVPTRRSVRFPGRPRRSSSNQGTLFANSSRSALVKPPMPAVMMWDDALQDYAEHLTGWETEDEERGQPGSVRLVGKIAGDEYNLEELLETVAEEMDADPKAIALVDYSKLTDVLRYDRNLERENRRLRRQLRDAGIEPRV